MAANKVASLLQRNSEFAETYQSPPLLRQGILKGREMGRRATVIVSCSDPRIVPEQFLGLEFSEAAIIRNAGGRTEDAVRTLLALDAIGNIGTVIVIHHTDCGMSHIDEDGFHAATATKHPGILEKQPGFNFGAISDPEKTVVEDVKFLKSFPSFAENLHIVGLVLDTHTGRVKQVDV